MAEFDIAIIGNGVAAAAAALSICEIADRRLSVVLVAPPLTSLPRAGEVLSPAGQQELMELKLWDEFILQPHLAANTTYSCWGSPLLIERNETMAVDGSGWYLDRHRFDNHLWQTVRARSADQNVCFHNCRVTRVHCDDDQNWCLSLRDGSAATCRIAIDCSGRSAVVARTRTKRTRLDRLVAAFAYLPPQNDDVDPTVATLIEAVPAGWWYSALLPNQQLIVGFFTDADLLPRGICRNPALWREALDQTEYTSRRVATGGFANVGLPRVASACTMALNKFTGSGWVAAGDAAMTFDPLSSHGITTAMWSGRKAGLAAVRALTGDIRGLSDYNGTMAAGFAGYRQQHQAIYDLERRFSCSPFWLRRHQGHAQAAASR